MGYVEKKHGAGTEKALEYYHTQLEGKVKRIS